MMEIFRRRLSVKLFLSYLAVILVGVFVLALTTEFSLPRAYDRHLGPMQAMMGGGQGMGMGPGPVLDPSQSPTDLYGGFRDSFNEALAYAIFAAVFVAIVVSILFSRSVVAPILAMRKAARRIAEGRYDERVAIKNGALDELGDLANGFNQMAAQLEQTESMRRQLIGDVTHELRTPLTAIKGSMEGLMDGVLPVTPETFEQIRREADRLSRLVDDLQELSRVESGAYRLDLRSVSIGRVIETVTKRLAHQFEEKRVRLAPQVHPNLPDVQADEDRILQVLINLVGNALQYTPSGGEVTLSAEQVSGLVQVSVRDTGIGIAPEHLINIFDRFYRVDKSRARAYGGSGIGLTIAKHLVEAHGGKIWVESEGAGRGSVFVFTLPVMK
jgi:histidine kinase